MSSPFNAHPSPLTPHPPPLTLYPETLNPSAGDYE